MKHILLDMDGVIVNFCKSAMEAFLPKEEVQKRLDNWPEGETDIEPVIGCSKSEFWSKIDSVPMFWETLEKYTWTDELLKYLKSTKIPTFICTSPSTNPKCASGKLTWLKNNTKFGRNFVITSKKYLLAQPDVVLIDDNEVKCSEFEEAGGLICKFPQPWNSNSMYSNNKIEFVKSRIEYLSK